MNIGPISLGRETRIYAHQVCADPRYDEGEVRIGDRAEREFNLRLVGGVSANVFVDSGSGLIYFHRRLPLVAQGESQRPVLSHRLDKMYTAVDLGKSRGVIVVRDPINHRGSDILKVRTEVVYTLNIGPLSFSHTRR